MKNTVVMLLLLFGLVSCTGPYDTLSKPDMGKFKDARYEYEGNTVRFTAPDIVLEASYLSPESLDLYFSMYKGGTRRNPFPPDSYVVYSLQLQNKGKKDVVFNPRAAMLLPKKGDPVHPKDFTTVYAEFELIGVDDVQERMDTFKALCFDSTVTLAPGETVQGLLAFPSQKNVKPETAVLIIDSLFLGRDMRTVPMSFGQKKKDGG